MREERAIAMTAIRGSDSVCRRSASSPAAPAAHGGTLIKVSLLRRSLSIKAAEGACLFAIAGLADRANVARHIAAGGSDCSVDTISASWSDGAKL